MQNKFGATLRELRKAAGLTQAELANEIGVDPTYISKFENGTLVPDFKEIHALADELGASRIDLAILAGRFSFKPISPSEYREAVETLWDLGLFDLYQSLFITMVKRNNTHRQHLSVPDIEQIVNWLLTEVLGDEAGFIPVNIEHLAHRLGLRFARTRSKEFPYRGVFMHGSDTIMINTYYIYTSGMERFTKAHEIGHAVVHTLNMPYEVSWKGGCRLCEKEADIFAGVLLMPANLVKSFAKGYPLEDPAFRYAMAKAFGVSVKAMEFRLRNLSLVTDALLKRTAMEVSERERFCRARYPTL